jgi:hypothetical protein
VFVVYLDDHRIMESVVTPDVPIPIVVPASGAMVATFNGIVSVVSGVWFAGIVPSVLIGDGRVFHVIVVSVHDEPLTSDTVSVSTDPAVPAVFTRTTSDAEIRVSPAGAAGKVNLKNDCNCDDV